MLNNNQLRVFRKHLEDRYLTMVEKSNNYKFLDEALSDAAAFKAMKILDKINQIKYLDRDVSF